MSIKINGKPHTKKYYPVITGFVCLWPGRLNLISGQLCWLLLGQHWPRAQLGQTWPPKAFSLWFLSLKQAVGGEHGRKDIGNKARGWLSLVPSKGRLEGRAGTLWVKGLVTS